MLDSLFFNWVNGWFKKYVDTELLFADRDNHTYEIKSKYVYEE